MCVCVRQRERERENLLRNLQGLSETSVSDQDSNHFRCPLLLKVFKKNAMIAERITDAWQSGFKTT